MALALGLRLSFEKLEKQQILICTILVVGTILGTMMVRPDFLQTLIGIFNFGHLPDFPAWVPKDTVMAPHTEN